MKFNEFINPKSMLTPAIAGSFIMIIANTLWLQFALPQKWTALFLSYLFLIPILQVYSASILEKGIYFFFNGLIVFAMAVNTNFAGKMLTNIAETSDKSRVEASINPFSFIKSAYAQGSAENSTITSTTINTTTTIQKPKPSLTKESATQSLNKKNKESDSNKRKFFDSWLNQ